MSTCDKNTRLRKKMQFFANLERGLSSRGYAMSFENELAQ